MFVVSRTRKPVGMPLPSMFTSTRELLSRWVTEQVLNLVMGMLTKPIKLPFVKVSVKVKAFERTATCRTPTPNCRTKKSSSE